MIRAFGLASLCLAALAAGPAAAQDQEPPPVEGPALRALGLGHPPEQYRGSPRGRLMAERAAQVEAVRNLALAAGAYFEIEDGDEKTRVVHAFIAGHVVTRKTERPDGAVEVEVALPIHRVAANFRDALAEAARAQAEAEAMRREVERLKQSLDDAAARLEEAARRLRER